MQKQKRPISDARFRELVDAQLREDKDIRGVIEGLYRGVVAEIAIQEVDRMLGGSPLAATPAQPVGRKPKWASVTDLYLNEIVALGWEDKEEFSREDKKTLAKRVHGISKISASSVEGGQKVQQAHDAIRALRAKGSIGKKHGAKLSLVTAS